MGNIERVEQPDWNYKRHVKYEEDKELLEREVLYI